MHADPTLYRRLILLLWFAWGVYWMVAAVGNKATQRRESAGSRLLHVLPLILGGALMAGQRGPWPALAERLWPHTPATYGSGALVLAAGLAFAVWARIHLGRNWSGTVTVKQGHELVRTGPYAYVRHPIYTGLITALLGTAIAAGTAGAALGALIIAASLVRKLRAEEVFMRATFPDDYPRYRAQVPMLIPFTRPRQSAPH